ncbi:hypothetical protein L7F22_047515 [Adiantum nelumboides]|nr:hypothetical protein [Adiantum nelumboides]
MSGMDMDNPYEECRLYTSNADRERWESMATLFGIIVSLDALERAYVRESVSEAQYAPACTRLLASTRPSRSLCVRPLRTAPSTLANSLALADGTCCGCLSHSSGRPATVEHASASSSQSSSERAKWVAETTQGFITFMDALKLKLRAKDQLHPLLSDLMSSYSRFSNNSGNDQDAISQGRAKVLHW